MTRRRIRPLPTITHPRPPAPRIELLKETSERDDDSSAFDGGGGGGGGGGGALDGRLRTLSDVGGSASLTPRETSGGVEHPGSPSASSSNGKATLTRSGSFDLKKVRQGAGLVKGTAALAKGGINTIRRGSVQALHTAALATSSVAAHRRGSCPGHVRSGSFGSGGGSDSGHGFDRAALAAANMEAAAVSAASVASNGGGASSSGAAAPASQPLRRSSSFGTAPMRGANGADANDGGGVPQTLPPPPGGGGLVRTQTWHAGLQLTPDAGGGTGGADGGSMFKVGLEAMEEVLCEQLHQSLDQVQEAFSGFDCEHSRFGELLSHRLGYMQVSASSWEGNEAEGMRREVRMVVKCPPKKMLPDTTRVHIKHRLRRESESSLMLEREVWTLDVPYGETWCLQERWAVARDPQFPESAVVLTVRAHVQFKSRGMLASKIRNVALKRSRKCAALALELLEIAAEPDEDDGADGGGAGGGAGGDGGAAAAELRELKQLYSSLSDECSYYKRRSQTLERENKKLTDASKYIRKTKKQLIERLLAVEEQLRKERRERAAMEVALSEAYTQTLREVVAQHDEERAAAAAAAAMLSPAATRAGGGHGGGHGTGHNAGRIFGKR